MTPALMAQFTVMESEFQRHRAAPDDREGAMDRILAVIVRSYLWRALLLLTVTAGVAGLLFHTILPNTGRLQGVRNGLAVSLFGLGLSWIWGTIGLLLPILAFGLPAAGYQWFHPLFRVYPSLFRRPRSEQVTVIVVRLSS